MESALVAVRNAVNRPQGLTRLAVDDLVENLAVMAEMGRLQSGIHYLTHQEQERVATRLDVCLAEYRRFLATHSCQASYSIVLLTRSNCGRTGSGQVMWWISVDWSTSPNW